MNTAINITNAVFDFYEILIVVYIISSWLPVKGFMADVRNALATLCEPYISVFRRFIPTLGGLDFSPFIAIIVLRMIQRFVISLLLGSM